MHELVDLGPSHLVGIERAILLRLLQDLQLRVAPDLFMQELEALFLTTEERGEEVGDSRLVQRLGKHVEMFESDARLALLETIDCLLIAELVADSPR